MSFKDKLDGLVDKLKSVDKERVYSAVKGSLRLVVVLGAVGVLGKDKKVVRVANEATEVLDKLDSNVIEFK